MLDLTLYFPWFILRLWRLHGSRCLRRDHQTLFPTAPTFQNTQTASSSQDHQKDRENNQ